MLKPQLKLKIVEIIEDITNIVIRDDSPDEVWVMRHRAAINKLLRENAPAPEMNYVGLALLDAIRDKVNDSYANFEKALKLAPNEGDILSRYSHVAMTFGDYRKSRDLALENVRRYPGSKTYLEHAINKAENAGCFSLSVQLLTKLDVLTVNEGDQMKKFSPEFVTKVSEKIVDAGLTDEDILRRLECAVDTVKSNGYIGKDVSTTFLRDGTCIHNIFIDADAEECAELNFKIADELVGNFENPAAEIYSINCRPVAHLKNFKEVFA